MLEQEYISVRQASRMIGIGKDTMYKMIHQSGFPVVKIGNKYLIRKDGLTEWMKDHEGKEVVVD